MRVAKAAPRMPQPPHQINTTSNRMFIATVNIVAYMA